MGSCNLHTSQRSVVIVHDISDHFPSITVLEGVNLKKRERQKTKSRKLDDCAINSIWSDLSNIEWSQFFGNHTMDYSYKSVVEILSNRLDEHAPIKEVVLNNKQYLCKPWMTKGLRKCQRKQLRLFEKSLKCGNNDTMTIYKSYRATLQKITRSCKRNFYLETCKKFKNNSKQLWKTLNNVIRKLNNKLNIIDYLKVNNLDIKDPNEITNEFGKYFSTIGKKIAMEGRNSNTHINNYLTKIPINEKSVFLTPCTETEIKNLINDLPNKSSSGYDDISNMLLKKLSDVLIKPFCILFNKSLSEGIFPSDMKLADVVPLYKSGNHLLLNNYRQISLLPMISKLLEKIVYNRIYTFFTSEDLIFKSQYGFRKKHSCEHVITELVGEITKGYENVKHTIALFLDLSKAFDTISHNILFAKLECYGVCGTALDWFKSYLSHRKIRTKCQLSITGNTHYSSYYNMEIGTPQGLCLGPLIFLIFCNDLHFNLEFCSAILFADDTTLYKSHKNLEYLKWCIIHDMTLLCDWFKANHLSLNGTKSVGMLFRKNMKS